MTGRPSKVFNPGIAQLPGTELALDPALGRGYVHDPKARVEGGIDHLRFADGVELLDRDNEALGVVVREDLSRRGRQRGWGRHRCALPCFRGVVVEERHDLEGVVRSVVLQLAW